MKWKCDHTVPSEFRRDHVRGSSPHEKLPLEFHARRGGFGPVHIVPPVAPHQSDEAEVSPLDAAA